MTDDESLNVVRTLREKGIARLDPMTSGEIADVTAHLEGCQMWDAHVKAKAKRPPLPFKEALSDSWPAFTTHMDDVVTCPHILEAALETRGIAAAYFQERPLLYSMNAFWTAPSFRMYQDTHGWHRDDDDRKQLVLFTYGYEVKTPQDGEHQYWTTSQGMRDPEVIAKWGSTTNPPNDLIERVRGPAGTRFMSDTSGLHMGLRPRRPRLIIWARWGVSDPPGSYVWDDLAPCPKERIGDRYPKDAEQQHAIHLVCR